jgi:hypothetical protein
MRSLLRVVPLAILGLLVASQGGCLLVAAAAGTGATVAYVRGNLETSLDGTPPQVADATERAFEQMDVAMISKSASSIDGNVVGRTAADTKLEVGIEARGDKVSKVSIRAGVFGDMAAQEHLISKIREQLAQVKAEEDARAKSRPAQPSVADVK